MKRLILLLLACVFALATLTACNGGGGGGGEGTESDVSTAFSAPEYDASKRTKSFYASINPNSFYFDMELTMNGETYGFVQATNGKMVTTIEDRDGTSDDLYTMFDGSQQHYLEIDDKYYDTTVTQNGQGFLFEGYNPEAFSNPTVIESARFIDQTYYCESFSSVDSSGNKLEDRYYFDGETLKGFESYNGDTLVTRMVFNSYSATVPSEIYLELPADFKKGNLNIDVSADISGWWD